MFTVKILKGAAIGIPAHFEFYVEICHKTQNDYHENKRIPTFCISFVLGALQFQKVHDRWKALEIRLKPKQPRHTRLICLEVV